MQTRLSLAHFPAAGQFLRHYADPDAWLHDSALSGWYHYNPHDPESIAARVAELQNRRFEPQRDVYAEAISAQQERWGAGKAARLAAAVLFKPDVFAVVTGQQTGLLGGPLYSQLKALSAIKLARHLSDAHPRLRFVPVFWMATGDSDFNEVRRTTLLDRHSELARLELPADGADTGIPVGRREHPDALAELLAQLDDVLPGGVARDAVLEALRADYAGPRMAEGFARWMARLFADTGLVLVDQLDPPLLGAATPLIEAELSRAAEFSATLAARSAAIAEAGYDVQVPPQPGDTNLFLLDEGGARHKLVRGEGEEEFVQRGTGATFSAAELVKLARTEPQRFVPGVMLGPAYQDALLRPAAFIGGAAELAYRAQAAALFELHGIKAAPAYLRATATLLPEKLAVGLDELGWELPDLYVPEQEVSGRVVADELPPQVRAALDGYRDALHGADAQLKQVAVELDPTLEASFDTLRGNLIRHVEKLEKKLTSSLKQRSAGRVRRALQAHALAYPHHVVQERELNLLSFLPRHGFELIELLLERLDYPAWEHQLVVL